MARFFLASVAVAATLLVLAQQAKAQETVNNPNLVMDLEWHISSWTDVWRIEKFSSSTVGQDVSYYVYLPPGYADSDQRYPVVYWLHGAYGRPYSATPVVRRLDDAIRAGSAPEMIIVSCIDPTGLSMWTNSKNGRLPMESVIIGELIPHVDANYRTIADRRGRGIEGFSMGGYGSAYLGVRYGDLFSSISILAGALHTPDTFKQRRRAIFDNVFSGDADYALERSPWEVIRRNAESVRTNTSMRVFVGAEDDLLEWNRNYHQLLDQLSVKHEWGVVPNAPHDLEILMRNWPGDFFAYYGRVFGDAESDAH